MTKEIQERVPIRSIVIDTMTAFMKEDILQTWSGGKKISHDDWKDYGVELLTFVDKIIKRGFTIVGVFGYEGTGKSAGMKGLETQTNLWFNLDNKNPTWRGGFQEYGSINEKKPFMSLSKSYQDVIQTIDLLKEAKRFDKEPVAFLLGHLEDYSSVNGEKRQRLKTFGRLSNKMNIEDMFTICLYTSIQMEGGMPQYKLATHNNGYNTARSYEGMFDESYIPNDFGYVINKIDDYMRNPI
jgi:hypothetical protein